MVRMRRSLATVATLALFVAGVSACAGDAGVGAPRSATRPSPGVLLLGARVVNGASEGQSCAEDVAFWVKRGRELWVTVNAHGPDRIVVRGHDVSGHSTGQATSAVGDGETTVRFKLDADPVRTMDVLLTITGATTGSCLVQRRA